MKATVLVAGREALPIRAIPFITGWRLSPDALVKDLAKHGHRDRYKEYLRAFQFDPANSHPEILPAEWEQVLVQLNALENRLDLGFDEDSESISYAQWRDQSPRALPKACFVWRDEFEAAMSRGRLSAALDESEAEFKWNYFPLVLDDIESVIMEGFESAREVAAANDRTTWPWGTYETKLLRQLAEAAARYWVNFDPTDRTTAPRNEDVVRWLQANGMSNNLAKAIATILRADGLATGPRG